MAVTSNHLRKKESLTRELREALSLSLVMTEKRISQSQIAKEIFFKAQVWS